MSGNRAATDPGGKARVRRTADGSAEGANGRAGSVTWEIRIGDALARLGELDDCSVDAVVCDPPYGLEFMGKEWDRFKPSGGRLRERVDGRTNPVDGKSLTTTPEAYVAGPPFQQWCAEWSAECLRVLKPGGHLLAFGGTRTYHRLASGFEDAGFEIRDCLAWLFGSGFPKSLDVSKAIDNAAGAQREVLGVRWTRTQNAIYGDGKGTNTETRETAPVTSEAERWRGWGTALKPAHEPIVVARKPLAGTVTRNVLAHGTGALNVDGCRIEGAKAGGGGAPPPRFGGQNPRPFHEVAEARGAEFDIAQGRWPANVVLDPEAAEMLDEQTGERPHSFRGSHNHQGGLLGWRAGNGDGYGDSGGASRFFYCAKASSAERNAGLEGFEEREVGSMNAAHDGSLVRNRPNLPKANVHPTVKPIELMRWLVRLVTPPGGTVLDPFAGSGTTGCAAVLEGVGFLGIEHEVEYAEIAQARIA